MLKRMAASLLSPFFESQSIVHRECGFHLTSLERPVLAPSPPSALPHRSLRPARPASAEMASQSAAAAPAQPQQLTVESAEYDRTAHAE
jgi:hypothetical protein